MTTLRFFRTCVVGFVLVTGLACCQGSGALSQGFHPDFPDNRPGELAGIVATLAAHPAPEAPAMVVITPPPPARGMAAFALPSGRRLWQVGTRIDARPTVVGDVVVSHADRAVIAWDARNGHERWRLADHGYSLIGCGGDHTVVALSLGAGGLNRRHGMLLAVNPRTGAVLFERQVEQALGVPTAAAGYVFVPWSGQYLSVFDVGRGEERARIRNLNDVLARARREGSAVYFGARAMYRLAPEAATGRRDTTVTFILPRDDLPGNPPLMPDGYVPAPAGINARERVAVIHRPDPSRPGTAMLDGALYALFHRVVFALDAHNGTVRWAYTHDADIAGAEPVRGGLLFVDERGNAVLLDAGNGSVTWQQALDAATAQAVIHVPIDFAPPRNVTPSVLPAVTTLIAAAGGTDTRLLPARLFAVRALATVPGAEATRGLLDIASRPNDPQELRAAAGEALSRRTEGIDALLEALNTHYDYVRGTRSPPVGFIARALANARDRRGVALLVSHLHDPETPATELPPLVAALKDLGDATVVPALLDFVRLYHSDDGLVPPVTGGDPVNDRSVSEQESLTAAMELAIQAIAQLGGPPERRWLQALLEDQNTMEPIRTVLQRVLSGSSRASNTDTDTSSTGSHQPDDTAVHPALPPSRLTMEMIREDFEPLRERMMQCLSGLPSRPAQVRITFRYDSQGNIASPSIIPPSLTPCLLPLVNQVRLRPSQVAREIGTYYLVGGPM